MKTRRLNHIELEVRRRIRLAIYAYAYEFRAHKIVSDAEYDVESYQVNLSIDTGRPDLDDFFRREFKPFTGQWIHKHPDLIGIMYRYEENYKCRPDVK